MRMGWEIPNPITAMAPDNATRFPFAVILPSTAPTQYTVTFTVTDDATTPAAISGATIMFSGTEKKTDSSGKAIFKVVENNTYNYAVIKAGKTTQSGKVTVNGANATVSVKLLGE